MGFEQHFSRRTMPPIQRCQRFRRQEITLGLFHQSKNPQTGQQLDTLRAGVLNFNFSGSMTDKPFIEAYKQTHEGAVHIIAGRKVYDEGLKLRASLQALRNKDPKVNTESRCDVSAGFDEESVPKRGIIQSFLQGISSSR